MITTTGNSFLDLLMENDETKMKEWISSYGKPAKPVSPIYFFYDLPESERLQEEQTYDIKILGREAYDSG